MSNGHNADRLLRSGQAGRQSAAFEDKTSGKHQRYCLTTPLGLEEQEMEMNGGESEREREREREERTE